MYYQYQQGFLDPEYYEDEFKVRVRRLAPTWRNLSIGVIDAHTLDRRKPFPSMARGGRTLLCLRQQLPRVGVG